MRAGQFFEIIQQELFSEEINRNEEWTIGRKL